MASQREAAIQYVRKNREKFLTSLKEFLQIPSVSNDPLHSSDIRQAANWMAAQLHSLRMQRVQIYPTMRHPIVYGEYLGVPGAPTVLLYGHYDVQPAEPLDQWKTSPFDPTIRGENLYARGVSDMKGQILALLKAVEALSKNGGIPVNLKWLIEGEEEIGSMNLGAFIANHKDLLACDFAFNPDAGMLGEDKPTITYALRGLAYLELRVYGPPTELHSGVFGGVVHNPAIVLAELIAGMHDSQGRVTLPGFYDKVRELTPEERAELARIPSDEKYYLEKTGVPALYGEQGFTPNELTGARPTLDVNGMISGFTGSGTKTIIPAWAMAKISCRLVPDQRPHDVYEQMKRYLEEKAPKTVRWELVEMHGGNPSISERNHPAVQAFAQALETVWGVRPYFKREGGSIPVVSLVQDLLGVESVIGGFGLPDDNFHGPNEKLHLPTWYKGIEALVHFFLNLTELR
ncbi:MAG: dipeptidase [Anaerolineales bacterium]|nr:dipeptidase [Anaerolineales bacterium]MCX7609886.1 dipeptidase [Anaerolineales bacterium]MDW8226905.1 dipeptidase [Anaerolineales bacterium]